MTAASLTVVFEKWRPSTAPTSGELKVEPAAPFSVSF